MRRTPLAQGWAIIARMRAWPRSLSGHSGTGTLGSIATSGWVMKKTGGTEFLAPLAPAHYHTCLRPFGDRVDAWKVGVVFHLRHGPCRNYGLGVLCGLGSVRSA